MLRWRYMSNWVRWLILSSQIITRHTFTYCFSNFDYSQNDWFQTKCYLTRKCLNIKYIIDKYQQIIGICSYFWFSDSNYMAVVTQNSFLYLYKYNYLEGWVRATFGYFKDIETVVPFSYNQRDYLYVSMRSAATALVVHQRG